MLIWECRTFTDSFFKFSTNLLYIICINDKFILGEGRELRLNQTILRIFEYPWDIERGYKIILYDPQTDELASFRYKTNYIDFASQFVAITVGGVILTLICKRVKEELQRRR